MHLARFDAGALAAHRSELDVVFFLLRHCSANGKHYIAHDAFSQRFEYAVRRRAFLLNLIHEHKGITYAAT